MMFLLDDDGRVSDDQAGGHDCDEARYGPRSYEVTARQTAGLRVVFGASRQINPKAPEGAGR